MQRVLGDLCGFDKLYAKRWCSRVGQESLSNQTELHKCAPPFPTTPPEIIASKSITKN